MNYEQLEDFLDDDLNWRKREITELLFIAKEKNSEVIFKSLILLLYSHWEGYIKKSSKLYFKYIVEKKIVLRNLSPNFKAAALKNNINQCFDSKDSINLSKELSFISKYLKLEDRKFKISIDPDNDFDNSIIDTKSNLSPKVLKNIYNILGISYKDSLDTRKNYIDRNLLHVRNTIGHGGRYNEDNDGDLCLEISDIERLKNIIVFIIDNFRDELLEYAYEEYFLTSNDHKKNVYDLKKEEELDRTLSSFFEGQL